jgi:hypothetical protein
MWNNYGMVRNHEGDIRYTIVSDHHQQCTCGISLMGVYLNPEISAASKAHVAFEVMIFVQSVILLACIVDETWKDGVVGRRVLATWMVFNQKLLIAGYVWLAFCGELELQLWCFFGNPVEHHHL